MPNVTGGFAAYWQPKRELAEPWRPRLGDTPHNYVVKRQNNQGNLFSSIVYEKTCGGGDPNVSLDLFLFKKGDSIKFTFGTAAL